jgi:propionyl-CoA carboxylase alpha chain
MEARVYAEDPFRNFLPSIGYLNRYKEPDHAGGNVRIDGGVEEGGEISIYYDPLISKLIAYGKNRQEAIDRLKTALDTYIIRGVNHNVSFIRSVLEHPKYVKGDISTKFIPQEFPKGFQGHPLAPIELNELIGTAAVMQFMRDARHATISGRLPGAEQPASTQLVVTVHDKKYNVTVTKHAHGYNVVLPDGQKLAIDTKSPVDSLVFDAKVDGKPVYIQFMSNIPQGFRLQHVGTQVRSLTVAIAHFAISLMCKYRLHCKLNYLVLCQRRNK